MYSMPKADSTTREHLIATTRELLWDRGYAATSPRAILDRAGVGQGSMYHHFSGKQELATAAFTETTRDLLARSEAALAGGTTAVERLQAYLAVPREVLRGCPVGRMAGDPEVMAAEPLLHLVDDVFAQMRARFVAIAEEGIAAGELPRELRADELADTVLAVVQGGYVLARAAGDPAPFDRAVAGATALLTLVGKDPS